MVKNKPVYAFEEADSKKRILLGGKGAGLCEMTQLKLPVPAGFTIFLMPAFLQQRSHTM